ncbi:DoxX family membrane protein [Chryseobacterium pennipullorum]|uniref:DoxX family protein n=1 Tax=Chryseobacterium pennipullorum TaxID=2258963 RepID=A0A3D9B896_9FLAO|nr:DoxX family membrane protein [Chryseobacterium pennipullorum]REC49649.1 DoxX family protein [Chryseobacterium pennipullorum]
MAFEKLRTNRFNQWVIIHLRYLVGFAFFPSGLVKLMGNRFTGISTDNPIGYFFEALYQSGFYWNFLGLAQITAGILLMTQRFAALGAMMFLAILTNIWIITISLSFKGTWVITSLMMIAVFVLLIWDKHKLLPLFNYKTDLKEYPEPKTAWGIAGAIYAVSCIALYILDPVKGNSYEKWLIGIFVIVIVLTFIFTNYKAYKNQN